MEYDVRVGIGAVPLLLFPVAAPVVYYNIAAPLLVINSYSCVVEYVLLFSLAAAADYPDALAFGCLQPLPGQQLVFPDVM